MNFNFENLLEKAITKHNIRPDQFCVIGSSALKLMGMKNRINRDVDIIIHPDIREKLERDSRVKFSDAGSLIFNSKVEAQHNRFGFMNMPDSVIFRKNFYNIIKGYNVLRPELLLCFKIKRMSKDDYPDISFLQKQSKVYKDWNWNIVYQARSTILPNKFQQDSSLPKVGLTRRIFLRFRRGLRTLRSSNWNFILFFKYLHSLVNRVPVKIKLNDSLRSQLSNYIHVGALLGNQFKNDNFSRYDIILRYLAVESIVSESDKHKSFYSLMQYRRKGTDTYDDLRDLVYSFKENGFLDKYPILIDEDGFLMDGAHRLSCALYFNIYKVPVKIVSNREQIDYSRNWFTENGFSDSFLLKLDKTKSNLFNKFGVWFSIILWPSVGKWFDIISHDIGKRIKIIDQEDIFLGESFGDFVREIYSIDDIDTWKVEMKIIFMSNYEPRIRIINFEIPTPKFRSKDHPFSYLSYHGEHLKKSIRKKYSKKIPDYVYDIVCHTSDNQYHNQEISNIIKKLRLKQK